MSTSPARGTPSCAPKLELGRAPARPRSYFEADSCTYAATSAICCGLSWSPKAGIAPIPFVTRWITSASGGFAASSDGPTVPFDPAAERTWQPPQPALAKTSAPAAGSPTTAVLVEVTGGRRSAPAALAVLAPDEVAADGEDQMRAPDASSTSAASAT